MCFWECNLKVLRSKMPFWNGPGAFAHDNNTVHLIGKLDSGNCEIGNPWNTTISSTLRQFLFHFSLSNTVIRLLCQMIFRLKFDSPLCKTGVHALQPWQYMEKEFKISSSRIIKSDHRSLHHTLLFLPDAGHRSWGRETGWRVLFKWGIELKYYILTYMYQAQTKTPF